MAEFTPAYQIGRDNEGGYVNVKTDKGGETYCGISRINWPNWEGWAIIDRYKADSGGTVERGTIFHDATLESMLKQFYYRNFWSKISGDTIELQSVASYMYDWSLTSGGSRKAVQKKLGVEPDGSFGPVTVDKLNDMGESALTMLKDLRVEYYKNIVAKDPSQKVNLKGWLNRANGLYERLS